MTLERRRSGADHDFPAAGRCVDCGKKCRTYRCPACQKKRERLEFFWGDDPDITYGSLEEIFGRFHHKGQP